MICLSIVFLVNSFFTFCYSFNSNVNRSIQFSGLEKIIKRGINRLCDQQSDDVLNKCKRPLLRVSDEDSEFDLESRVGTGISGVLGMSCEEVNERLELNYNIYPRLCNDMRNEISTIVSCTTSYEWINIKLRDEYILDQLDLMMESDRVGVGKLSEEKVLVDYFSPNIGKRLHVGHLRSLAIGQSISNLLAFAGSKVLRRNHVGDFGSQTGILTRYIMEYDVSAMDALNTEICDRQREMQIQRIDLGCTISNIYHKPRINKLNLPTPSFSQRLVVSTMDTYYKLACEKFNNDPEFKKRAKIETKLLQNSQSLGQKQWETIREASVGHYDDIVDYFYMNGLKTIPESLYKNISNNMINDLLKEGKAKEINNSVVIDLQDLKNLDNVNSPNKSSKNEDDKLETIQNEEQNRDSINKSVLRTSEGSLTYMATDLAALSHRINWNKPNRIIYITDENQKPHFEKMYKISNNLKIIKNCEIEHLSFGQVNIPGYGKMRSRTGNNIGLIEATKEVIKLIGEEIVNRGDYLGLKKGVLSRKLGVGAILFSDLSVSPKSGYIFSIERVMKQGNNLLLDILYSYVRSLSILKMAEGLCKIESKGFRSKSERRLGLTLIGFENTLVGSLVKRRPDMLCKYLLNLSSNFNTFYEKNRVIDNNETNELSLKLVHLTSKTIELGLKLLNIQPVKHL